MCAVFFTADTHFGEDFTLSDAPFGRPFATAMDMNSALVANWNRVVSANDDVYHLGDFGDIRLVSRLNGTIHFLPGNHDSEQDVLQMSQRCEILHANHCLVIEGVLLTLVHEPRHAVSRDAFYLFGHLHGLQMVKRNGLNVGVDCHNFVPLSAHAVLALYKDITSYYEEQVFSESLGAPP